MTVPQMRAAIYGLYPGASWHKKVENMPEAQVIAVYHKFLREGKFDQKESAAPKKPDELPSFKPMTGEQLIIDI